jgi:cysteine desulfurase
MTVYCDANAGATTAPEVLQGLTSCTEPMHNPSSSHFLGQKARHQLESDRETLAIHLGVASDQIVFTSGGSESVATALWILKSTVKEPTVLLSRVDHPIARSFAKNLEHCGTKVEHYATQSGLPDEQTLDSFRKLREPVVLHLQSAHSELASICSKELLREIRSALPPTSRIHLDACQSLGKHDYAPLLEYCDAVSFSSHKIGGLVPGEQEWRRRAGTENSVGIRAMRAAAENRIPMLETQLQVWAPARDRILHFLEGELSADILSARDGLPQTIFFRVPGFNSHRSIMELDQLGIAVSPGTACRSGLVAPNETALAMGYSETEAAECIRISLDWGFSENDEDLLLQALKTVFSRSRS